MPTPDIASSSTSVIEAVDSPTDGKYTLLPTLDEYRLVSRVQDLFLHARDKRRPLVNQWNKNYRMLRNRHWTSQRPQWMPRPEVPEIFPLIASFVGWMTDQRPEWQISPWALPNSPYSDFLGQLGSDLSVVLKSRFQDDDVETEIEKIIWDSQIYGTGISKVSWDGSINGGMGDVITRRIDPYSFYPDPQANNMREANYFIEARTYSLQELDRRWPGTAAIFTSGYEADVDSAPTQLGHREDMPMANPGAIAPATVPRYTHYGQSRLDVNSFDDLGVTVFECWIREHIVNNNRAIDGWRVIIVAGDRVLMNERAEDIWEHGEHPYDRYVPYDMGEFWGLSLVELLTSPQESLNRLLASIQYNIELLGNPVFVEGTRSGLQRQQITNKPGQRLTVNDNAKADWLQPPPLHEMIPELIRYFLQRMETISGLSAITRGGSAPGRNAQGVIDAMQEASFVRIRMALRNLERFMRRMGTKVASLVVEYYDEPRMVAVLGSDGQPNVQFLHANHFSLPGGLDGKSMPLRFRLNVDVGSQTQTSREAREAKAMTMYGMGAIDDMALLEAVDFPNRKQVFERVQQLKAAGAFQPPGARQRSRRQG